ncbi:MAG TPA: VCBS repeat-containing protein, partial [bacterium]
MKYTTIMLMFLPALLWAQEYEFHQEWDSVSASAENYHLPASWTGGYERISLDACDLDGDSDKDLIVGGSSPYLHGFKNMGNSVNSVLYFESGQYAGIDCSGLTGFLNPVTCDIDADGDFDLFIGTGAAVIQLYSNAGNPSQPYYQIATDTLKDENNTWIWGEHPDWVDMDADGALDLICGRYTGTMRYYENIGDSLQYILHLVTEEFAGVNLGYQNHADPCLCDIDADDDYDLFIGDKYGYIHYYLNDGTPQQYNFTLVSNSWMGIDVGDYASPEFADMDGDGDYDLWVGRDAYDTNGPGDVFFYENIGTSQAPQMSFVRANNLTIDGGSGCGPVLVDNDQDGDLDLWYTNGTYLTLFNNVGSATSPAYSLFGEDLLSGTPAYAIDLYDLDADGDPDLISSYGTYAYNGLIKFYENVGTPQNPNFSFSFQIENTYFLLGQVALADMDADGDGDMLVGRYSGNLVFYENQGTSQSPDFVVQTENWQNIQGLSISLADMDLDGDFDLLNRNPVAGRVWLYENIGTPQSAQMVLADTNLYGMNLLAGQPRAGDLDGDGDMDILNGFFDGGMHFLRNITGDTSAVGPPPVQRHPRAGLQISLGPNPANPITVVSCQFLVPSNISLQVFDISGRMVV